MIGKLINYLLENKLRFFVVVSLWLGAQYLLFGSYSFIAIFDNCDSFVPRLLALKIRNANDYWYPYIAGGVDQLSQQAASYQYLYQLLTVFLPVWVVYLLHAFLHFFISGYFTYRLCKEHLNLSETSSLVAGLFYAFYRHEFMIISTGYDLLPFILLSFDAIYELSKKSSIAWLWLIGLALLTSMCSELTITTPLIVAFLPFYFCFLRRKYDWRFWSQYLIFSVITMVYYTQIIWAMHINIQSSQRVSAKYIVPAVTAINSDLFHAILQRVRATLGSYLLSAMIVGGILVSRFKNRNFNTLLAMLLVTTVGAALSLLLKASLMPYIAYLRGVNFDYLNLISPFFYALTAAYLFDFLPKNGAKLAFLMNRNIYQAVLMVVLIWFVSDTLILKKDQMMLWIRSGNFVSGFRSDKLKELAKQINKDALYRVATVRLSLLPAYANGYGLESADGYTQIYSEKYFRFWSKVIEPLTNSHPYYDRYFNNWGNRIYLFPPNETASEVLMNENYRLNLLSLANTKYFISRAKLVDERLVPISEVETPFYSLSKKEMLMVRLKENFLGNYYFNIYENTQVLPRFFMTQDVRIFQSADELLTQMAAAPASELRKTAFVESSKAPFLKQDKMGFTTSDIRVDAYAPDAIQLSVKINGSGILIVTNTYHPFWKVKIDGEEGIIIPVYHTFWGVPVRKGSHRIAFYYDPPYKI